MSNKFSHGTHIRAKNNFVFRTALGTEVCIAKNTVAFCDYTENTCNLRRLVTPIYGLLYVPKSMDENWEVFDVNS